MDTLIINALLTDCSGERCGWLRHNGSAITAVGAGGFVPPESSDCRIADLGGARLCPGLIDSHVHFRQPGMEYKGTIATESRAALEGGMTMTFDMPNTSPATTTLSALKSKNALGRTGAATRYKAFFGLTPGCIGELKALGPADVPGVKLFLGTSTGAMGAPQGHELEEVLRICADKGLTVVVHAEDNDIIAANAAAATAHYGSASAVPAYMHSTIRSAEACFAAAARAVELAHRTGARIHLAHVSTAREARELLDGGPTASKLVTAETTALYLDPILSDPSNRTERHKVNPAIKTAADSAELRVALADGRIDTIATDHAPHLLAEKRGGALTAASGAPSVQFAVPVMLTYLPAQLIVARMTSGVADVFGMADYGRLQPGYPADFTVIEETSPRVIADSDVISPCGWTPFAGRTVRHRAIAMPGGSTRR